jgi:hypothetical protein
MKRLVEWLIKKYLPGYHLHRDPVRKEKPYRAVGTVRASSSEIYSFEDAKEVKNGRIELHSGGEGSEIEGVGIP